MLESPIEVIYKEKYEPTGTLDLSNWRLTDLDKEVPELFEDLGKLKDLKVLILSNGSGGVSSKSQIVDSDERNNNIRSIPKGLLRLTNLEKLIICGSGKQKWNIIKLENLPSSLKYIDISYNNISKIESLPASLKVLNISYNNISILEKLPASLEVLNISSNKIEKIGNLPTSIKSLNISWNNKITEIVPLYDLLKKGLIIEKKLDDENEKGKIYIKQTGIIKKYSKILEQENNYLFKFVEQLKKGGKGGKGEIENIIESKLLIIGESGAGKTTLAKRLVDPFAELPSPLESNHDIKVDKWEFNKGESSSNVSVNIWDFGGQEIYHATHQFFFSQKSIYLLLADTRKQKADFIYWLNAVEQIGGKDSILLIILNQRENHSWEIDNQSLKKRFGEIYKDSYNIDLSISEKIPELQRVIKNWLTKSDNFKQPLIKNWLKIRDKVLQLTKNKISLSEFQEICQKFGENNENDVVEICKYFHRIGVFTHYYDHPELKHYIYLNSNFLVKSIYLLLNSNKAKLQKGKLTKEDIKEIWPKDAFSNSARLALLEKFGIVYKSKNNLFIIPEHLPRNTPYENWQYEEESSILYFRYKFDRFKPRGLMSRLIVELHEYITDIDLVWYRGVNINYKGAYAEIKQPYHESQIIEIRVAGINQIGFLSIISSSFDKILINFNNLEIQRLIRCPCKVCSETKSPDEAHFHDIEVIENALKKNVNTLQCTRSLYNVNIRTEILNFVNVPRNKVDKIQTLLDAIKNLQGKADFISKSVNKINENSNKSYQLLEKLTKSSDTNTELIIQNLLKHESNLEEKYNQIIEFIRLAFMINDVIQMENFEEIKSLIESMKSSENNLETKLKFVVPIIDLIGLKIEKEVKFDLKKFLKNLKSNTEKFVVKHNLEYF